MQKKAIVSVISDLVTDNRVNRVCTTLQELGYQVTLIGRKLSGSPPVPDWPFSTRRLRMVFTSGPLFYLFFNLRLFFLLLISRKALLYANDLDTLLPNYLVSKLKRTPLIYDSHELFCEVPELQDTPLKKKIWEKLEGSVVLRLKHCITVSSGIAEIFEKKYRVKFTVIRNLPVKKSGLIPKSRTELGLPVSSRIIILQGSGINVNRGAEELVEAMSLVENALLLIIGGGDVWEKLGHLIREKHLSDKVKMIGRMPSADLRHYTASADLGISIDKGDNLNYRHSLPNKLFDYILAEIPVLSSRLPEIEKIVTAYGIGEFIESHTPQHIAARITDMLSSPELNRYRNNCRKAGIELNWENEKAKLAAVIDDAENSGMAH